MDRTEYDEETRTMTRRESERPRPGSRRRASRRPPVGKSADLSGRSVLAPMAQEGQQSWMKLSESANTP